MYKSSNNNENQQNLESSYVKLYYETNTSTQKIMPYYVRFENHEQALQATELLEKLGFEKIIIPNTKSFNLYVNFEFKRYCHPQIALWHLGCKEHINYEQFKTILQDFLPYYNMDINQI